MITERTEEFYRIISSTDRLRERFRFSAPLDGGDYEADFTFQPTSIEELKTVLTNAMDYRLPIYIIGSGSKFRFGYLPFKSGLFIQVTGLDKIIEYDKVGATLEVEAGVKAASIVSLIAKDGFVLPFSDQKESTVGGQIATNTASALNNCFGKLSSYLLWLEVLLPEGKLVKIKPESTMMGFAVGSWGTFGVITRAKFKLRRRPSGSALLAVFIEDAGEMLRRVRRLTRERLFFESIYVFSQRSGYILQIKLTGHDSVVKMQSNYLIDNYGFIATEENKNLNYEQKTLIFVPVTEMFVIIRYLIGSMGSVFKDMDIQIDALSGVIVLDGTLKKSEIETLNSVVSDSFGTMYQYGKIISEFESNELLLAILNNADEIINPYSNFAPNCIILQKTSRKIDIRRSIPKSDLYTEKIEPVPRGAKKIYRHKNQVAEHVKGRRLHAKMEEERKRIKKTKEKNRILRELREHVKVDIEEQKMKQIEEKLSSAIDAGAPEELSRKKEK